MHAYLITVCPLRNAIIEYFMVFKVEMPPFID